MVRRSRDKVIDSMLSMKAGPAYHPALISSPSTPRRTPDGGCETERSVARDARNTPHASEPQWQGGPELSGPYLADGGMKAHCCRRPIAKHLTVVSATEVR